MTDQEKLALIAQIIELQTYHLDADEGDKYLSQCEYAQEAIEAVIYDNTSSSSLRMFTEAIKEGNKSS
jgi:hypothetical protein